MNEDHPTVQASDLESYPADETAGAKQADKPHQRFSIHVHSVRKRLADADGISAKAAIDGLVLAGLLPDDSPKYVKAVTYSQEKGSPEKTIMEIIPDE